MSSVFKSILMLHNSIIPPQVGMPHSMNPNVLKFLHGKNIVIPTESTDFKSIFDKPKRILVNNFDAAASFFLPSLSHLSF